MPYVSKHHYAIELLRKNNDVWYCGPNDAPGRTTEGITTLANPKTLKGIRFLPIWIRWLFNRRTARYFNTICGGKIDIVWSFDTSRLFDLRQLFPDSLRILHITDFNMEFAWKKSIRQADICLGVSDLICNKLKKNHGAVFKIPHGCSPNPLPIAPANVIPNTAAYAGNLNIPYINLHLMSQLIRHYSHVSFHFYGPYIARAEERNAETSMGEILALPNVTHHNTLPAEALQHELATKSILLLCYDQRYREQIANPHKLMTYLSAGRPILSTTLLEYQWLDALVCFEDNVGAYLKKFGELIEADDKNTDARIRVAQEHAYPHILEKISRILELHTNG